MKAVGARLPRYDGIEHVTGRTQYVDDVRVPGMLWTKALRSPVHSATIKSLDVSKAEAMPGVRAVITWEDVPLLEYGHLSALGIPADEPLLAKDEARYKGQPIALVAAEDVDTATAAVEAIALDLEERTPLFDIRRAFDDDAPKIHHWGNWYPHFEGEMDRRQIRKGSIEDAFEKADAIVQGVYRPAAIEHVPLETQVSLVVPEASGRLTIYSCTQALYFSLGVVAAHLQVPLNRLKVVGGTVGGGFGGKVDTATETMCALLAQKSGRPVKWRWTREEEFLCSSTRAPWHMEIADAVTKDGWILGSEDADPPRLGRLLALLSLRADEALVPPHGRVHDPEPVVRRLRRLHEPRPDDGDARLRRHLDLVRHRAPPDADRARAGARSIRGAAEEREPGRRHLAEPDRLHRPLDRRRRQGARRRHGGRPRARVRRDGPRQARRRPASRASRRPARESGGPLMATHKGRGIAAIEYPTGMNQNGDPSQAWIKVKPDGRIDVFAGTSDIGNGSKTIQSQIVAETIGVPYDWVTYDNSNTDSSPVCTGTFASRATFVAGKAVEKAAEKVREKILEIAGKELEIDPSDLEIVDGEVLAKGAPQKKIGVPDVAGAATWTYGELITGTGAQLKPYAAIVDPETGEVDLPPHSAISYAACAAEVEVDDETGIVTVDRLVQVYDVGRALNPTLVEGQIEGGAVQGLGLGILENCYPYYPSAEHRGGQFGSYLAPGFEDLPKIDTIIIENPSSDGPYGAKGIGEMANNAQPPAIAAAVFDAVGVWVTELPITPERILRALEARSEPARNGKTIVFDAELSVNAVSKGGMRFEVPA